MTLWQIAESILFVVVWVALFYVILTFPGYDNRER